MANKAGIINADTGAIVGVPDALVQVGGVWTIAATAPGTVPASRQINTTAPLTGGGDLSADRTLAIAAATAGNDGYMTSTQVATLATAASTAGAALPKAGGTMTGAIDMGSQKITSLGTPTATTDAATKGYVDTAVVGLLDLKGSIDCSGNPNYPAALKGDVWVISVAGLIGGASGISVQAGDAILALADNAGGTQAAVGSSWSILQANLVGALLAVNNLSDVQNVATARNNLGLGTAATQNSTAFATAAQGTLASTAVQRAGDTMTGNLGVGGAPTTQIDVINPNAGTNANFRVRGDAQGTGVGAWFLDVFSGVSGHGFYGYGAKSMLFGTAGATRMLIDSAGKVGINTTTPLYLFHISTGYAKTDTGHRYTYFMSSSDGAAANPFGGLFSIQGAAALANRLFDISTTDYNSAWGGNLILQKYGGKVGIGTGTTVPTALLLLAAGTATAGTAPLKLTSGTNLTTPEAGALEYNGTLSFTGSSAVRKDVALKTTYTPSLTPAAVGVAPPAEQTFTVTGLTTSDTVIVNAPGAAVFNARVSAADTLAITFEPAGSGTYTPPAGTYRIVAIRS